MIKLLGNAFCSFLARVVFPEHVAPPTAIRMAFFCMLIVRDGQCRLVDGQAGKIDLNHGMNDPEMGLDRKQPPPETLEFGSFDGDDANMKNMPRV